MHENKYVVHLRAPILSQSGYGAHAREVIDYLLEDGRFIVCAESINWGECAYIHNDSRLEAYYNCIGNFEQAKSKNVPFDLSIQVTIPNEFSKVAPINIGVTAGIEVDRCTLDWLNKCNEMDYIVVPSEFSKKVLNDTVAEWKDRNNGSSGTIKIEKPIFVIPQWFSEPEKRDDSPISKIKFSTKFNFLCVGQWGVKGITFGEDRKNIGNLVKIFYHTFKDEPDAGLVLKVNIVNNTEEDLFHVKERLNQIKTNFPKAKCKVHLIHQAMTDQEISELYSHPQIKAFVSLTAGEGFGRPLLEAASAGLPVVATDWSGHLDFLRAKHGYLPVEFELSDVPECQIWPGVIEKGSRWAKCNEESASKVLKKFFNKPTLIQEQAKENLEWLAENFSKEAAISKWNDFFNKQVFGGSEEIVDVPVLQQKSQKQAAIEKLKSLHPKLSEPTEKEKVIYIMPRSTGDVLMSTAVVDGLLRSRHVDSDFYFATSPQYKELLEEFDGITVIDYCDEMMATELTSEVWDVVYNPTVNLQYNFSNWRLGNGHYAIPLVAEMAKHCNLYPGDLRNYRVKLKECSVPEGEYIVFAPTGTTPAKDYAHWDDVLKNLKLMFPDVKIAQTGLKTEKLYPNVLDFRGKNARETMYLISKAQLVVGVDSFPAHAAAATGVDYVVLYGCTDTTVKPTVLGNKKCLGLLIETTDRGDHTAACFKDSCKNPKTGKNSISNIDPQSVCNMIYDFVRQLNKQEEKEAAE